MFFFRAYVLQNYFENPLTCKILIFISFFISLLYGLINVLMKNKVKLIIYFIFGNEIMFLIFFIIGQDFLQDRIPNIVLNVFYLICYFGKFIENVVIGFFVYYKNKNPKKVKREDRNFKKFEFIEGLTIKIDQEKFLKMKKKYKREQKKLKIRSQKKLDTKAKKVYKNQIKRASN